MGLLDRFTKKDAPATAHDERTVVAPSGEVIVVATEHHAGALRKLPKHDPLDLELVREPGSAHDPNAIAVRQAGETLGYLSSARATSYAPIMDEIGRPLGVQGHRRDGQLFVAIPDAEPLARTLGVSGHVIDRIRRRKTFFLGGGPKEQAVVDALLAGRDRATVTGTVTSAPLKTGAFAGHVKHTVSVDGRVIGAASPKHQAESPWVFAMLESVEGPIEVHLGRSASGRPWARLEEPR